jgi:hypothetical protein
MLPTFLLKVRMRQYSKKIAAAAECIVITSTSSLIKLRTLVLLCISGIQPIEVDGPPPLGNIFYRDVHLSVFFSNLRAASANLACSAAACSLPLLQSVEGFLLQGIVAPRFRRAKLQHVKANCSNVTASFKRYTKCRELRAFATYRAVFAWLEPPPYRAAVAAPLTTLGFCIFGMGGRYRRYPQCQSNKCVCRVTQLRLLLLSSVPAGSSEQQPPNI